MNRDRAVLCINDDDDGDICNNIHEHGNSARSHG